jgi:hypothetical protein
MWLLTCVVIASSCADRPDWLDESDGADAIAIAVRGETGETRGVAVAVHRRSATRQVG